MRMRGRIHRVQLLHTYEIDQSIDLYSLKRSGQFDPLWSFLHAPIAVLPSLAVEVVVSRGSAAS